MTGGAEALASFRLNPEPERFWPLDRQYVSTAVGKMSIPVQYILLCR